LGKFRLDEKRPRWPLVRRPARELRPERPVEAPPELRARG
jgi:hypothetical protein